MYSSLQKIDLSGAVAGQKLFAQTDHRTADEVAEDPELSTIFALTRLLKAKQQDAGARVRYVSLGAPHPVIAQAIVAAGAEAEAMGSDVPVDLSAVPRASAEDLADEAFAALAKRVLAREGVALDEDGLKVLEARLRVVTSYDHEDEIPFWTQVAELSAVTGELLRATRGGRWVRDTRDLSPIPFLFDLGGGAMLNVAGKAYKFSTFGEREAMRQLLRAAEDVDAKDGPLLISMKPASWPGAAQTHGVSFGLDRVDKVGANVPFVALGYDRPQTFAFCEKSTALRAPADELRREALANLEKIEVEIQRVDLKSLTFYIAGGSYFAAEKLLDRRFMQTLHAKLGSKMLLAGVPEKGRLFVATALAPAEATTGFTAIIRGVFDKNEGGKQLCPTVFLVTDGELTGVAMPRPAEPPPEPAEPAPKKGFLSRMFGRN